MLAPSGGRLHLHACSRGPVGTPRGGGLSTRSGCFAPGTLYPTGRRLLLVVVHLLFANDYSRPIRVRRASQVPQGRVPRGVHGKAW